MEHLFVTEADRNIFFRYAFPCLELKIKFGSIEKGYAEELIGRLAEGRPIPESTEEMFMPALGMCMEAAERAGKRKIDAEAVREYFIFRHREYLEKQASEGRKKGNTDYCTVYPGVVTSANGKEAVVKTPKMKRKYRKDFEPGAIEGSMVLVHRGFVVEQLTHEIEQRLADAFGWIL